MLDPATDGDVIHGQAALRHDLLQIAVAQRIPQVPSHAENDNDLGEVSPLEWRWSGPAHHITVPEAPELLATHPYRALVTDLAAPIDVVTGFYQQRAGAENLIKEANNDAGLTAHPSTRWSMNCVHFQLAMLAYNLNCWLMLFNREEQAKIVDLRHTTLATARLRFLFLAAKIVRHAGAVIVRYSDHYAEKETMARLMNRLRSIVMRGDRFAPVLPSPLPL